MTFPVSSAEAKLILVSGVVFSFALLLTPAHAQNGSQWGNGKNLYDKVCAHCHSPEVGVGPAIGGRGLPQAYLTTIVRNGLNAMPAFPASYIDDESLAQLTEYLSTLPAPAARP